MSSTRPQIAHAMRRAAAARAARPAPAFRVVTPCMIVDAATLERAHEIAHGGLDSIAAKRGYSMSVETLEDGSIRYSVQNSKGRTVTGCRIVAVTA